MEIREGIHRIEGRLGDRFLFQHVLVGDRIMLIDTGVAQTPTELILPYLADLGLDPALVDYVLCTHPDADHSGGNATVRRVAPGCRFLGHRLDARWLQDPDAMVAERYDGFGAEHGIRARPEALRASRGRCGDPAMIDVALTGGEQVSMTGDWQVEIIHAPGHSEGHLAVWDPRSRTLIIGDASMARCIPNVDGTPALAATYTHPGPYATTSERLSAFDAEWLLTAHYPAMQGGAIASHFADTKTLVADVDDAVTGALAGSGEPIGLRELIDVAQQKLVTLPPATRDSWACPLAGHLRELEMRAVVDVIVRDGRKLYSLPADRCDAVTAG